MAFESMYLEEDIHIDRIYTIHYFEYKSDFHFAGERHNFWEFQCVDKGKAEIETPPSTNITSPAMSETNPTMLNIRNLINNVFFSVSA